VTRKIISCLSQEDLELTSRQPGSSDFEEALCERGFLRWSRAKRFPEHQFDSGGELRRYETLFHRGLAELFREPAERLREFTAFELAPSSFTTPQEM
jgi:hypothetical protein